MSLTLPLPRVALKLCTSSCSALKFASLSSRCCVSASRQFTCALRRQAEGKRKLVTATAYRPHTIDHLPTPPRNSDIPDTSIVSPAALPAFHDIRPPKVPIEQEEKVEMSEQEARKSRPMPSATAATATAQAETTITPTKATRPRLRPRKAAMTLTPSATKHLKALLALPDPKLIRVGVRNRGCSGLAYHLEYVDKPGTFDEAVEQDGVKVLIDSKALFSIIGSEMDWVEDKLSARFVFRNPNIKEECGCGESFMV